MARPSRRSHRSSRPYISIPLVLETRSKGPSFKSCCNRAVARSPKLASAGQRDGNISGVSIPSTRIFLSWKLKVSPSIAQLSQTPFPQRLKLISTFSGVRPIIQAGSIPEFSKLSNTKTAIPKRRMVDLKCDNMLFDCRLLFHRRLPDHLHPGRCFDFRDLLDLGCLKG